MQFEVVSTCHVLVPKTRRFREGDYEGSEGNYQIEGVKKDDPSLDQEEVFCGMEDI